MAERAHIPGSPACGHWETLLADALDGLLGPDEQTTFAAHMAACPACAALFEEARRGREWLEFLSPEPEVPEGLLDRILAQTGPGKAAPSSLAVAGVGALPAPPAWQRPGFTGQVRRYAEPRLLMTAAMAFFSIALTLNLTGVRLSNLRLSDLRPAAVRAYMERRLTTASIPIVRYYDHLRYAYEIESRMRELRGAEGEGGGSVDQKPQSEPPGAPGESREKPGHKKDGGSRVDPPQESGSPTLGPGSIESSDYLETSLRFERQRPAAAMRNLRWRTEAAHSGGSARAARERSIVWTA